MPYIPQEQRDLIDSTTMDQLALDNPGQLAYALSRVLKSYMGRRYCDYATYAAVFGALETVKLELYRDQLATYEDIKRNMNGPVW